MKLCEQWGGVYCKSESLPSGSKIPAWKAVEFNLSCLSTHPIRHGCSIYRDQHVGIRQGTGGWWCWWVWGSKNQQCNTGRGGDDSICTLVGGPQVEQIQRARAATGRRIHRGGEAGKMERKWNVEITGCARLQRARPAPDIRGPGWVVVLSGKFFWGGPCFTGDSQWNTHKARLHMQVLAVLCIWNLDQHEVTANSTHSLKHSRVRLVKCTS